MERHRETLNHEGCAEKRLPVPGGQARLCVARPPAPVCRAGTGWRSARAGRQGWRRRIRPPPIDRV